MAGSEKEYEQILDEYKKMIASTELVTARMLESITRNSQLASSTTPEMQEMFTSWLRLVAGELVKDLDADKTCNIDISATTDRIGLTPATVISLLLYLQRSGEISVKEVSVTKGNGNNREICHGLK